MILVHAEVVKNTSSATVNSEMKIPPSISIVGTGNVAEVLGQRLIEAKLNIVSVIGRNENRARQLSTKWGCEIESYENITGDLILVAVSDEATTSIVDALNKNKLVAITSGSIELSEINHPNSGIFYPLQTFSKDRTSVLIQFPLLIESKTDEMTEILFFIGQKISSQVEICNSEKRKKVHLSAVFMNNFSNHMIQLGQSLAVKNLVDPNLFNDLIQETFEKLKLLNPKESQTGPARRNDLETIQKHLDQLDSPEKEIYIQITNSILKTYGYDEL